MSSPPLSATGRKLTLVVLGLAALITTGLPFSSSPRVSIRPRCHGPVGYSGARNRTEHRFRAGLDPPLKFDLTRHRRTGQLDVPPVRVSPEQRQLPGGPHRPPLRQCFFPPQGAVARTATVRAGKGRRLVAAAACW